MIRGQKKYAIFLGSKEVSVDTHMEHSYASGQGTENKERDTE
jgi:hypothetical protein